MIEADRDFKKIMEKSAVIGGSSQAMLKCVKQNTSMHVDDGQKRPLYKKLVKELSPVKKNIK